MHPEFSVIIVHHRGIEDLARCLGSLIRGGAADKTETIVVDNASNDELDPLKKEFRKIHFIPSEENVGWGRAVNLGAQTARGEILVLLNPDAELFPGSLEMLKTFFAGLSGERIGPVGGKLLFSNGARQPSCGPFPRLIPTVARLALPKSRRKYYLRNWNRPAEVDWVTGAFMAVRKSVFDELGGFDPKFFLYYEDVDFCLRARKAGYPSYYVPQAAAFHHHPHAVRAEHDSKLAKIIQQSRLYYFSKHRPVWERWLLGRLHRLETI